MQKPQITEKDYEGMFALMLITIVGVLALTGYCLYSIFC